MMLAASNVSHECSFPVVTQLEETLSEYVLSLGLMFSSFSPAAALVLGVHSRFSSFSDSRKPFGNSIPHTVPSFCYEDHAEPVMYPRTMLSIGKTLRRRATMLDRWS